MPSFLFSENLTKKLECRLLQFFWHFIKVNVILYRTTYDVMNEWIKKHEVWDMKSNAPPAVIDRNLVAVNQVRPIFLSFFLSFLIFLLSFYLCSFFFSFIHSFIHSFFFHSFFFLLSFFLSFFLSIYEKQHWRHGKAVASDHTTLQ